MLQKKKPKQRMGQQLNKYHMTDDGKVYRVNEDGSFTSIGNVEDLEKKPSTQQVDNAADSTFYANDFKCRWNRMVEA